MGSEATSKSYMFMIGPKTHMRPQHSTDRIRIWLRWDHNRDMEKNKIVNKIKFNQQKLRTTLRSMKEYYHRSKYGWKHTDYRLSSFCLFSLLSLNFSNLLRFFSLFHSSRSLLLPHFYTKPQSLILSVAALKQRGRGGSLQRIKTADQDRNKHSLAIMRRTIVE